MGRILTTKDVEPAVKGGSVYVAGGGGWARSKTGREPAKPGDASDAGTVCTSQVEPKT